MLSGIPTLFHITPNTSDIASCQANEKGRRARKSTFSLNGVKGFHYG
jgi:hypothetical protein